jgi:cytochrome c biogenesis protein CcmG/thiol:disulfide interchange protein DsbE
MMTAPFSPQGSATASPSLPWRRLLYGLPLILFLGLAVYFWAGLGKDPHALPSVLIDQPVPPLALEPIEGRDRGLSSEDLKGDVVLVNVFASWCAACAIEHPFLMKLKAEDAVRIYGINWREKNRAAGPAWLKRYGDPYTLIGDDPDSRGAIAFGVTGAPETFVVDRRGVIRYKHAGPVTAEVWEGTLRPIIARLRAE